MPVIFGDATANTIAATGPDDVIFGLSGFDTLSSTFERADLRGGWGRDTLTADFDWAINEGSAIPPVLLSLRGDQGDDTLLASVDVTVPASPSFFTREDVTATIVLEGGIGNDTHVAHQSVTEDGFYELFIDRITLESVVVDLDGDNGLTFENEAIVADAFAQVTNSAILGNGNDTVTVDTMTELENWNAFSTYEFHLGDGLNSLTLADRSGFNSTLVTSGAGADIIDIAFSGDAGNDGPIDFTLDLDTGGGDDAVTIQSNGQFGDAGEAAMSIDLGDGDNTLSIANDYQGSLDLTSGDGTETFDIVWTNLRDFGFYDTSPVGLTVATGNGDKTIDIAITDADRLFYGLPPQFADITTGSGNDTVTVAGGIGNRFDTGGGNDVITPGSGSSTVAAGAGADDVLIDAGVFLIQGQFGDPLVQTLVLEDFNVTEGDRVILSGFDIPALRGGIIDAADDLAALVGTGGDVISFVQEGADARLSLAVGTGQGDILFKGVTIGTAPADPPMTLIGTAADDTLTGGTSGDLIFLRRGDDTATGGDGADRFKFNALAPHNLDGDAHTITDLDFTEGDTILFANFGAAWADDATDPANALTYEPGTYNTWIADSVADLQELEASGAISVTALAGGSRLSWLAADGDAVSVDLFGIFV
ncbi:hypothetical protein HKCCE2091_01375 [Rhodobacterales bacterium HKCCE2091]|nr:hypothetical protein [Rhodobacterales bacterium HKCCE2091]